MVNLSAPLHFNLSDMQEFAAIKHVAEIGCGKVGNQRESNPEFRFLNHTKTKSCNNLSLTGHWLSRALCGCER